MLESGLYRLLPENHSPGTETRQGKAAMEMIDGVQEFKNIYVHKRKLWQAVRIQASIQITQITRKTSYLMRHMCIC